jgi:uncharacterized iron-regulated membrane protein
MKTSFRQSMSGLHTWTGLLFAWLLYFMFITGTAGYFDTEIDRWMQPELPVAVINTDTGEFVSQAQDFLSVNALPADRWLIVRALDRNDLYPRVLWQQDGAIHGGMFSSEDNTLLTARETGGGQLLYQMHWRLHYMSRNISDIVVGIATMFMLLALITGIIIHKKIFKDFFTFRPAKGSRSWLDLHNLSSVLSLPFQLMITYSGLVFMMLGYVPVIISAHYGFADDARQQFNQEIFSSAAELSSSGQKSELTELSKLVTTAETVLGKDQIRLVDIRNPGDQNARVIISDSHASGPLRSSNRLIFDGVTGEQLEIRHAYETNVKAVRDVLLGLHEGLFAAPLLRWLYFFSGLLGAMMIATGLVLWAKKRRQKFEKQRNTEHLALKLVERLNVATIVGLPIAIACYFFSNRLLPVELAQRADWEAHVMFISWALMFIYAACRPIHSVWRGQLYLATGLFISVPLVNMITSDRHLIHSLQAGDWVLAGFDLTMFGLGLVFAIAAQRVKNSHKKKLISKPTRPIQSRLLKDNNQ